MKTTRIDLIGENKLTGELMLIICQKSHWVGGTGELEALQARVNDYLTFVMDGPMAAEYPTYVGRSVRIGEPLSDPPSPQQRIRQSPVAAH